jgi:hypothetical protein
MPLVHAALSWGAGLFVVFGGWKAFDFLALRSEAEDAGLTEDERIERLFDLQW